MIFLRLLGALLAILMWGDLAYQLLVRDCTSPAATARRMGMTWVFGSGLVSWGLFVCLWAGLSLATAVTLLSLVGGLLWSFWRAGGMVAQTSEVLAVYPARAESNAPSKAIKRALFYKPWRSLVAVWRRSPWSLVFVLIILTQTGLVAFAATVSPLTDWDAWVNWASKANAIFIDQTLSADLYNNPARLSANMDYPLMLPLLEAWFYTWQGHIHEPAIGLISFLFYVTLLLLFYHAARQLVLCPAALGFTAVLATIPRLERMGHNGLADVPLATLTLLSFLLLFYEYNKYCGRGRLPRVGALALSAGLLPWLKNEGWLWLLLVSATWLAGVWCQVRRKSMSGGQALNGVIFYGLIVLAIAGSWPYFLAVNGTYRFTFLPLTGVTLVANLPRAPWIARAMLGRLLNPYWNFIWLFTGLFVLLRRAKSWSGPAGWLILPVTGYLFLVGATYIFSRFEPYLAHLNNSAERLVLQATPLALWWLIGQSVAVGWVKGDHFD